jgi:hypothetical protein
MTYNVKCGKSASLKMVVYITENGIMIRKMEEEFKYGQMALDMKDNGASIERMVMVEWFMQKVTFMKVNGSMTKLMEKEPILKIKEVSIKELG